MKTVVFQVIQLAAVRAEQVRVVVGSRSRALPHDEAQAGVDGVQIKEILLAGLPSAAVEVLAQALESGSRSLMGSRARPEMQARTSGLR
jgi:hypothetical protein